MTDIAPQRRSVRLPWGAVSLLEWQAEDTATAAERPTVVLLHGAGADSAELSWSSLSRTREQDRGLGPELAAAGFRVIAPDHPGFGHSGAGTWPVDTEQYVDYLGELIAAVGLDHYVLGGLSFGGALALGHALRRPEGLDSLVLLAPHGIQPGMGHGAAARPARIATRAAVASGALRGLSRLTARSERLTTASLAGVFRHPQRMSPALQRAALQAVRDSNGLEGSSRWQRSEVTWDGYATDHTPRLHEIAVPVLLVNGADDRAVPVARAAVAAERLPHARFEVVADAGHWVQRERPEIVLPLVRSWLEEDS